ncbi:pulmonary surfactant-associated protein A-like [Rhinophrynus dorsalis]
MKSVVLLAAVCLSTCLAQLSDKCAGAAGIPGLNGLPGIPASVAQALQSRLLALNRRIDRLEGVLRLEGKMQAAGGKIFATNGKQADFESSKSTCKDVGGSIATPTNEEENKAVLNIVKEYNRYAYLGIKEDVVPGLFQYLNGIPAYYTNWYKNEPSGKGKENCVEMYTDGQWNDKACNQNRLIICEL